MQSTIASSKENTLRITEVFYSLQGESTSSGLPTLFIRLTGCPLRCHYCDTAYAFQGGEQIELHNLLLAVQQYEPQNICVTGGEPLAQPNCLPLLSRLCDNHYPVSLETSGALDISQVDQRVRIILDLKTPGSGEADKNLLDNLEHLKAIDEIKFVICDKNDYNWAKALLQTLELPKKVAAVLFSPCKDTIAATDLANWIVQDNLPVRFQLQLHKQIWGDTPGV